MPFGPGNRKRRLVMYEICMYMYVFFIKNHTVISLEKLRVIIYLWFLWNLYRHPDPMFKSKGR